MAPEITNPVPEHARLEAPETRLATTCALICGAAALVASWLTFSDLPRMNSADSLIPIFASLYRWTWFYWVQNRYGMLTPLLAMPIHHPLLNLLFQNWIAVFSGLMVFPLASAYLVGWRNAPLAGLVGATVFLLAGPNRFHEDYLLVQPYGVSTCLGLVGLLVMASDRDGAGRFTRRVLSVTLYFLSFWVSMAALFLVLPLFGLQWCLGRAADGKVSRRLYTSLLLIIAPALVNWQIATHYQFPGDFGWTPPFAWPGNWATLLNNAYQGTPPAFLVAIGTLLTVGAVGARFARDPSRVRQSLSAFAVALLAALFYSAVLGATAHVSRSGFHLRYVLAPIVLTVTAFSFFATSELAHALKRRWEARLQAALLLGLLVGVALRYGQPSYARVRQGFDERFGSATSDLLASHCTHVLGDYWDVWGMVFHANLTLYESGSKQVIWALTSRSQVTSDLWNPLLEGGLVAVPRTRLSEEAQPKMARLLRLPELELIQDMQSIRVYEPGAMQRAYGPADMVIQNCMTLLNDGTIVGENCPPGALVFGPYVGIPKGATVSVAFEFQSEKGLKLSTDVVSSKGKIFHGAIDDQEVDPKTVRAFNFRVYMFQDASAAEARIGFRASGPASFKITNFKLALL